MEEMNVMTVEETTTMTEEMVMPEIENNVDVEKESNKGLLIAGACLLAGFGVYKGVQAVRKAVKIAKAKKAEGETAETKNDETDNGKEIVVETTAEEMETEEPKKNN